MLSSLVVFNIISVFHTQRVFPEHMKSGNRPWWVVRLGILLWRKIGYVCLMNTLISVNELFRCVKEQLYSLSIFCCIILILNEQFLIKSFYSKLSLFYVMLAFALETHLKSQPMVILMLLFIRLSL